MNRQQKFKIEKKLMALPFVNWDRYVDSGDAITIFGWIKRNDDYKDFAIIEFSTDDYEVNVWATSSKEHSESMGKIFQPDSKHNVCQRVEHKFNVKNCIRLKNDILPK